MGAYAAYDPSPNRRLRRASIEVREATLDDVDAIARLIAERHERELEKTRATVEKEVRHTTPRGVENRLFVAEDAGRVAGFGRVALQRPGVHHHPAEMPEGWYLIGVIVAPDARRRGIGEALGRHRLAWIRERADAAFSFINRENWASRDLLLALGFEPQELEFRHERAELEPGQGQLYRARL